MNYSSSDCDSEDECINYVYDYSHGTKYREDEINEMIGLIVDDIRSYWGEAVEARVEAIEELYELKGVSCFIDTDEVVQDGRWFYGPDWDGPTCGNKDRSFYSDDAFNFLENVLYDIPWRRVHIKEEPKPDRIRVDEVPHLIGLVILDLRLDGSIFPTVEKRVEWIKSLYDYIREECPPINEYSIVSLQNWYKNWTGYTHWNEDKSFYSRTALGLLEEHLLCPPWKF